MELTLVRHAPAHDGADDAARALTPKGRARFERCVETMDQLGVRFDRVLHSPKVRAVETAELLLPLCDGELEETRLLTKAPKEPMLALLKSDRLALVGHEPWLTSLLAWLVVGDVRRADAFELKKGAVARLEGEPTPGHMRLVALWTPKLLRR